MKSVKASTILIVTVGILIPTMTWSQSQGAFNPGIRSNSLILGGSSAWANPNNAAASDNSYTVATNGTSNFLMTSNYGFSIPLTATITGIMAEVERNAAPVSPVSSGTWSTFTPPGYVIPSGATGTATYGSTSYSYNLPVSSATNNKRLLVVTLGIENVDNVNPTDPSITFGTVTYNGTAMTLATSNSMASATTSNNVAVYYLVESGLPAAAGPNTLVINKTLNGELSGGTISPDQYVEIVGVNTFTDVNQSTPFSAVSQTSGSSPITSPAINTVRNGDYMVAATMNNTSSGGSVTQATGYTENFEIANNNGGTTSGAILEVQSKSLSGITGAPTVTVSATAAGASRLVMGAIAINSARVYDKTVMLIGALGLQVGNNLAVTPSNILSNAWPDADAYQTYGGAGNLWGTTWTPAQINSSNFGLSFQADAANSIASVDNVKITVYYSVSLSISLQSFTLTQTSDQVVSLFSFIADDNKTYTFTLEKAGNDLQFIPVDSIFNEGGYTLQNLTMSDANPYPGINYYRIRIDAKASVTKYSALKTISFGNAEQIKILAYPNPIVDYLMVKSDQKITSVVITDLTGKNISVTIISVDDNTFRIENIPAKGLYTLMVNTDSAMISRKIITN